MNYKQTLEYLFSRLPVYQREGKSAYKSDIGNIIAASKILREPHKKFKSVHIAGTNGKGSVSHMLASILQEANYKVGLYTSPHLKDFRERVKINGTMITKLEVIKFVSKHKIAFEKIDLSFFEFTVALAFDYFANQKVDIAIIETGLGGRLDTTNIIDPELSIITNIGFDHTNLLGNTIQKIAKEKAGIIKQNTPVIIGRIQKEIKPIFKNISDQKNAPLKYTKKYKYLLDLKGEYQQENSNTAVSAVQELQTQNWKINTRDIIDGLLNTIKNTGLLGRWQILGQKPLIICDAGHNEDGIKIVFKQIRKIPHQNLHIVFGVVNDKDLNSILNLLPRDALYYFCSANIKRGLNENILQDIANKKDLQGNSYTSVQEALEAARKKAKIEDLIFIGGSSFIIAEVV